MPPLFRCTMFLEQNQTGWSETYFSTAATYQLAGQRATFLCGLRMAMSPSFVFCPEIRTSDDNLFRDVYFDPNFEQIQGSFPGQSLQSQSAVKIRMVTAPIVGTKNYYRTLDFSGLPAGQQRGGSFWVPTNAWIVAFQQYQAELITGNWGLRVVDQVQNPKLAITQIAPGGVITAAANVPNIAPFKLVRFYWPRGHRAAGVASTYIITNVTNATTFTVPAASTFVPAPMFFRLLLPSLASLNNGTVTLDATMGNHKRGRPFDLPLGRRRNS